jgi:hypothetical protein
MNTAASGKSNNGSNTNTSIATGNTGDSSLRVVAAAVEFIS